MVGDVNHPAIKRPNTRVHNGDHIHSAHSPRNLDNVALFEGKLGDVGLGDDDGGQRNHDLVGIGRTANDNLRTFQVKRRNREQFARLEPLVSQQRAPTVAPPSTALLVWKRMPHGLPKEIPNSTRHDPT